MSTNSTQQQQQQQQQQQPGTAAGDSARALQDGASAALKTADLGSGIHEDVSKRVSTYVPSSSVCVCVCVCVCVYPRAELWW